ncbi:hypothetical protein Scep_029550 [Stephania cephalantha]|uniref:Uncharacterized protein n=1 Tax=Stephania cephalantha TaxID=152367 RepID=A0AAP0E5J2_9MAGN
MMSLSLPEICLPNPEIAVVCQSWGLCRAASGRRVCRRWCQLSSLSVQPPLLVTAVRRRVGNQGRLAWPSAARGCAGPAAVHRSSSLPWNALRSSLPWNALRSSLPRPSAAAGYANPAAVRRSSSRLLRASAPLAVQSPPPFAGLRRCRGTLFVDASKTIAVALYHRRLYTTSPMMVVLNRRSSQPSPLGRPSVAAACAAPTAGRRYSSLSGESLKRTYKVWNASLEWLRASISYELHAFEAKLQRRRQELTQTTPDQPVDDEAVYYKVAGECPKGRVYGLESLGRKKRRYVDHDASTSQHPQGVVGGGAGDGADPVVIFSLRSFREPI